jgi:DnaJ-class molecular chaperone
MDFKDYYSTLGVAKTSTDKEIKQAYRKLARKHHPDVNPGDKSAENRFKEINEAYEVLGDPEKRKKYDELGANWRMYEQAGSAAGAPFGGGGPFGSDSWNVRSGGGGGQPGGGFRTMTPEEMREMFGTDDPFSDFFHTFFGGATAESEAAGAGGSRARGGRRRGPQSGRDFEQEIELGLEDAYRGTTRRLAISHDGQHRTVDVRIPAGVAEGSRVRVSGEGESGTSGGRSGDLYLRVRLASHPTFERKGRDLYTRVPVPLTTAVLGGEAEVPTLDGKPLRLKIPPTTQNGQVFRLKGHGMPAVGKSTGTGAGNAGKPAGGERGDLYATVEVQLPRSLTPEQRKHFEALKDLDKAS